MDNPVVIIILVVVAIAAVVGITWAVLHHRYVKSIEAKGWQWHGNADPGITVGMNNPPFGLGFKREAEHHITGRSTSGVPFQAFEYEYNGDNVRGLCVTMPLSTSLPDFYAFAPEQGRPGVTGHSIASQPLQVVAEDPRYGQEALSVLMPHLQPPRLPSNDQMSVDVSIDHAQLVVLGAPRKADDLEAVVNWAAEMHRAIEGSGVLTHRGEEPPRHLSFHQRSHWAYIPRDDSYLSRVPHTGSGYDHQARDIIVSDNFGLPFIRLHHHWKTRHTRRTSDGKTRTEVRNHDEVLCQFATSFPFREISVNWGFFSGRPLRFESVDFNDRYKVRCGIPRFASDVFHPRQMEWMLRNGAPAFSIEDDGTIQIKGDNWYPAEIDGATDFLRGFFAGVPDFVWGELGMADRPQLDPPRN